MLAWHTQFLATTREQDDNIKDLWSQFFRCYSGVELLMARGPSGSNTCPIISVSLGIGFTSISIATLGALVMNNLKVMSRVVTVDIIYIYILYIYIYI